jgi:4'-phosphopantetheinyl transferase
MSFPDLFKHEVFVWSGHTHDLSARIEDLRSLLTVEERDQAGRFHFEEDRARFILARGCLRLILGRYLNQPPGEVILEYTPYGKPQLSPGVAPRGGLTPANKKLFDVNEAVGCRPIEFNISHSGEYFLIALSHHLVGIDIEVHRSRSHLQQIAQRFFSDPEWKYLESFEESGQVAGFYTLWTRKEAFIKGVGQGLSYPLRSFSVLDKNGRVIFLNQEVGASNQTSGWFVQQLPAPEGYSAAVATLGGPYRIVSHSTETLLSSLYQPVEIKLDPGFLPSRE